MAVTVPVSITGTVAFSTTARISPAPPRGIKTSTYPFIFINSVVVSLEVSSINAMAFSSTPHSANVRRILATIAIFEWSASLPHFKITAFPVLKQSPKASAVTFGRAS